MAFRKSKGGTHSGAGDGTIQHGQSEGGAGPPEAGLVSNGGGGPKDGTSEAGSSEASGGAGGPAGSGASGGGSQSLAGGTAGQPNAQASGPSLSYKAQHESIADARGTDWAVDRAMRGAVPIQRPIQVVVRENQVALLPSKHSQKGAGRTGTVISLDQPHSEVSDQFASALKARIDDWGLAGNGLYWRPVLELNIGPEAGPTAKRLVQLLKNSGVEIRLPQTAQASGGPEAYGPR